MPGTAAMLVLFIFCASTSNKLINNNEKRGFVRCFTYYQKHNGPLWLYFFFI